MQPGCSCGASPNVRLVAVNADEPDTVQRAFVRGHCVVALRRAREPRDSRTERPGSRVSQPANSELAFVGWTVRWTVLSANGRFLAVRSGRHARPTARGIPWKQGECLQIRQCRRRDSNPRHADYDSACSRRVSTVSTGDFKAAGARWTWLWTWLSGDVGRHGVDRAAEWPARSRPGWAKNS